MPLEKDREIQELRSLVEQMHLQTSRSEREKQQMRNMRGKLDAQLEIFGRIHQFSVHAFRARSQQALNTLIPEGVVDIFQLEIGAVYRLDVSGDSLELLGELNLTAAAECLSVSRAWLAESGLMRFDDPKVVVESPPADGPFAQLDLAHAVYAPMFDNDRKVIGLVLGGVTREGAEIYDFVPEELTSSFMVYCQQMNGIYNNFVAIAQAKAAGEAKMRFLANLSHEIRTPMNAISGMVQIAMRSDDPVRTKQCVSQIGVSLKHLLSLLNDVLDISKIEEDKLTLDMEAFGLDALVEGILASMRQAMLDKGLRFSLGMKGLEGVRLIGDPMRLSQVLLNLLSNAIKFTPEGGAISLDVEERSRDHQKALIQFSVSDSGIGMSEEAKGRVFSAFEQADGSTSRRFGGTGLGLTISQRIVELMGSRIKVRSAEGKGSRFYFSVWFDIDGQSAEQQTPLAEASAKAYDFSGKRILIVDDVAINREIVLAFLEGTGALCEEASNGEEAVEKIRASAPGYYDLVLMDVQMPIMDGCDATRVIRAMPREDAQRLTILAMTANVFAEDMQMVADAGMNGHIGKPMEYEATMNFLERCLSK